MSGPSAAAASQSTLLSCLGPITLAQRDLAANTLLQECIDEVAETPAVEAVGRCVNELAPPQRDANLAIDIDCSRLGEVCPSPIIDLDYTTVCGIGISIFELEPCEPPGMGIVVSKFAVCLTVTTCPAPAYGIVVNGVDYCTSVQTDDCDPGELGVRPACIAPPSNLVYQVIGIVLGAIGNGGCSAGTMAYHDSEGYAWCATPGEIRQDSYPRGIYPTLDTGAEESVDSQIGLLALDEPAPDLFMPQYASPTAARSPTCSSVCTVIFIRGYDSGTFNGYGNFEAAKKYYQNHGYTVYQLDTYGKCAGTFTDVSAAAGNHDTWFGKHHDAGTWCSPAGSHDQDTDIRHMSYHVTTWIARKFGTQPVDVVAHSMGGLLIRYGVHMSGSGEAGWPTAKLNIQDIVTVGTPHRGFPATDYFDYRQQRQMDGGDPFMTLLRTEAENPQGFSGTDWTLIGSDEDHVVGEQNAIGMKAAHRLWYNKNWGGWSAGSYDHEEYFLDDSESLNTSYWWYAAEGGKSESKSGPHSVKRMYWGSISAGH